EATGEADPGNGEVVFGSLGGGPVESVGGYLHLAHRILLDTVRHSGLLSAWTVATLKGCPVKRCRQPASVTILSVRSLHDTAHRAGHFPVHRRRGVHSPVGNRPGGDGGEHRSPRLSGPARRGSQRRPHLLHRR